MKFLEDLGLSAESKLVLIIAWKFRAETQCEFTKDEFVYGMMDLGYFSIFQFSNLKKHNLWLISSTTNECPLKSFPALTVLTS